MIDIDTEEIFINKINKKLESMSNISIDENNIFKDKIKIGFIENEDVYFFDKKDIFKKVSKEVVEDDDQFLQYATRAYWLVTEKI